MEEPLFMFQLIIAVDVSEHRSIYNKLNAPCSGDFNERTVLDKQGVNTVLQVKWPAIPLYYFTHAIH